MLSDFMTMIRRSIHSIFTLILVLVTAGAAQAQTVMVDSAQNFSSADIFASGGETFEIEASGASISPCPIATEPIPTARF